MLFEGGPVYLVVTLASMLERKQGELQCASWKPPSLNEGVPTTQQLKVIVPWPRTSDFLGKLKNPGVYAEFLNFKMTAMNPNEHFEKATQKTVAWICPLHGYLQALTQTVLS